VVEVPTRDIPAGINVLPIVTPGWATTVAVTHRTARSIKLAFGTAPGSAAEVIIQLVQGTFVPLNVNLVVDGNGVQDETTGNTWGGAGWYIVTRYWSEGPLIDEPTGQSPGGYECEDEGDWDYLATLEGSEEYEGVWYNIHNHLDGPYSENPI
jgi:hypothetical protein